ncbi:MAG TPA: NAD-dependent epimerase/dehydratase family protein [Chthoniobacterales bacterium]
MPRVLIAGCGYVGRAIAELLHARGWEVEGWTSSSGSAEAFASQPYEVRAVDLTDAGAVKRASGDFDAIVHCASSRGGGPDAYRRVYLDGARNLAAAMPATLLLFTSSTSVYAQRGGEWVDESSAAEPERETGRILREAEDCVLAQNGVVARLAGIYGPGRSALLRKLLDRTAVIDPADRFLNQAHRDDIASALVCLLEQSAITKGSIYNVTDNHPILQRDAYEWLARELGRAVPPISSAPVERKRGASNKRVSSRKLHELGWQPRYPSFQSAMRESILPSLSAFGA